MKIQQSAGLAVILLVVVLVLSSGLTVRAEQKRQFSLHVNLDPGQWKAARLKNLVRDASLSVSIHGFDAVDILILKEQDYQKFPEPSDPLFKGRSFDQLTFTIDIPVSGDYFLLFDNRRSAHPADLQIDLTATASGPSRNADSRLQSSLDRLSVDLHKLFIFDPVPIVLRSCNTAGVFSVAEGIVLCHEFVDKLQTTLRDQQKTTDVLLFAIFHEFGHHLMLQWDYPFYDNEEIADEFATALLMMLRQQDRLQAAGEFFIQNPNARDLLLKAFQDDRHPLSAQRARNILNWMKDPNRIGRWQLFLLPHMQTETLEALRDKAKTPKTRALLDRELSNR